MKVNPAWTSAPYEEFCVCLRDGGTGMYIDKRVIIADSCGAETLTDNPLNVYPEGVMLRRDFPKRYDYNKVEVPVFIEP